MLSLTQFLMESIENIKDRFIIQTPEDAINFFGIENENEKMFVQALFEIAPLKPDGDGKNNPFVGNYSSKSNFALRRWAQDNPNVNDLMNKYNIKDFNSLGSKNKKFGGYHNTNLEKIDNFPSSSEQEYFVALSLNIKALGKNTSEENIKIALKYALFGDREKDLDDDEQKMFDKYYKYYKDHNEKINNWAKDVEVTEGKFFKKQPIEKNSCSKIWKENSGIDKPNATPKTDIMGEDGQRISLKKDIGAQAMSGGMAETMATLLTYAELLDEDDREKLESLFEDKNGNPIDWSGKDTERNKMLDKLVKEIFSNPRNKNYIMAVIAESITGAGKFGADSNSTANSVITWGDDGSLIQDDMDTYLYNTYKAFAEQADKGKFNMVTINHKSSGNTWSVLRMFLPKHKEQYSKLDKESNEGFKRAMEIIENVRNNNSTKSKHETNKDSEEEATIEGKKVIIKTGPAGGKYFIHPNSKEKVYVKRNEGGKYEIKTRK